MTSFNYERNYSGLASISMLTVGADPEVFVINPETGAFVSAIDKLGGSKIHPRPLDRGICVQEDNVLCEYNIPACSTKDSFVAAIEDGLSQCRNLVLAQGLDLFITAQAILPEEEMQEERAYIFGCEPDFDAWNDGEPNRKPNLEEIARERSKDYFRFRTAGGHVHLGFREAQKQDRATISTIKLVKAMDMILGCWSVLMDDEQERRLLYGKAGCYRPKPYGLEYRTLSNFWLKDPELIEQVYHRTRMAYILGVHYMNDLARDGRLCDYTKSAINTGNRDKAVYVLTQVGGMLNETLI